MAGRWWPALLGALIGVVGLLDIKPWVPPEPTTMLLPGLAVAYLVFGVARRQLGRPGVLRLELLGVVLFGGCTVLAALVDPRGRSLHRGGRLDGACGLGRRAHRDLSGYRSVGVVPRGYAEFCIVLDLLIGASLIVAPVA